MFLKYLRETTTKKKKEAELLQLLFSAGVCVCVCVCFLWACCRHPPLPSLSPAILKLCPCFFFLLYFLESRHWRSVYPLPVFFFFFEREWTRKKKVRSVLCAPFVDAHGITIASFFFFLLFRWNKEDVKACRLTFDASHEHMYIYIYVFFF